MMIGAGTDDDRSRNLNDIDRAALSKPLDETQQSWLLGPHEQKKKKYVDLGCVVVSKKIFVWTVGIILGAGFSALLVNMLPHHHPRPPPPDNYTLALRKVLMFFNAQRSMDPKEEKKEEKKEEEKKEEKKEEEKKEEKKVERKQQEVDDSDDETWYSKEEFGFIFDRKFDPNNRADMQAYYNFLFN